MNAAKKLKYLTCGWITDAMPFLIRKSFARLLQGLANSVL
jgi:hypothetical protein